MSEPLKPCCRAAAIKIVTELSLINTAKLHDIAESLVKWYDAGVDNPEGLNDIIDDARKATNG